MSDSALKFVEAQEAYDAFDFETKRKAAAAAIKDAQRELSKVEREHARLNEARIAAHTALGYPARDWHAYAIGFRAGEQCAAGWRELTVAHVRGLIELTDEHANNSDTLEQLTPKLNDHLREIFCTNPRTTAPTPQPSDAAGVAR